MTSSADPPGIAVAAPAGLRRNAGPLWLAVAVAASVPVFWLGLSSLVEAWSIPEYSHGPIIPLISTFLFLREMRRVPPAERPIFDRWPGVAVVAFGLAVGVLGNLMQIHHVVIYGFIIWTAGLILTTFGLRRGALFWPAVVHLVFMLPLPQILYWQISTYLQTVSSQIGVGVISLVGIPVYLDGNIIDLGVYKLQVAEACSGLRYLFPMLSFSYVFAVLYQGPKWHKAALLLSAAPITVLMNSFRIGVIGVMVDNFGIEQAEGFLHTFEGWIIFLACVVILFGEAIVLQRLTRDPRPLSETLDIEFSGLGAQLARARDVAPSAGLIATALVTAGVSLGWALVPERETAVVDRAPLVVFPQQIGDWRAAGLMQTLDARVERTLGADDYFGADYAGPEGAVNLFIAWYEDQNDGTGIHSPEACIPAGGWEVSDWSRVSFPDGAGGTIEANRAVIQKGALRQLVYFWFDLRGRRVASSYFAKALNMLDAARHGRSDGALIRLITPVAENEPAGAADARLRDFAADLTPVTPRFIPPL